MQEYGEAVSEEELELEALINNLAEKLDKHFGVNNEFHYVIRDAVNEHAELIAKQKEG